MERIGLVWSIADLVFYVTNLGFSIYGMIKYFWAYDTIWGSLTAVYTIMPMVIACIMVINIVILDPNRSMHMKCLLIVAAILGTYIMPVGILLWNVLENIRGHDTTHHPVWTLKMFYAFVNLYPNVALKVYYLVSQYYFVRFIVPLQWLDIVVHLIALATLVSTSKVFDKYNTSSIISRVIFLMFGMLAVVSRLLVASVFALQCIFSPLTRLLWFVPIGTGLVVSIVAWFIIRFNPFSPYVPLDENHHDNNKQFRVNFVLFWMMTTGYDSFTITGVIVSTFNLGFALGCLVLAVPTSFALIAIIIAILNWVSNLIISTVPKFKRIKQDWLQINKDGF